MNKTVFGILTILTNAIGVPHFITGNTKKGILVIVLSIIPCFGWIVCNAINFIKGIIGGIKILKMTEEEYEATLEAIKSRTK